MVRFELIDCGESVSDTYHREFQVQEAATVSITVYQDTSKLVIDPSTDSGVWKSMVVKLVRFDLQARPALTTVWLIDGTSQSFETPRRVCQRLQVRDNDALMTERLTDVWGSHVLKELKIAPTPALWQLSRELEDAKQELQPAIKAVKESTEKVAKLVSSARKLRRTALVNSEGLLQPSDLSNVPADALQALFAGVESDIALARRKVGDMQAKVEYQKGKKAREEEVSREIGVKKDETSDDSDDSDGVGCLSPLQKSRNNRDKWHSRLESLLSQREAVHARMSELEGSFRTRMKQRWSAMMGASRPAQIDRVCLSHLALSQAIDEAKSIRTVASEQHTLLLQTVAEAENQLDVATRAFNGELLKMSQASGNSCLDRGYRRRDSFSDDDASTRLWDSDDESGAEGETSVDIEMTTRRFEQIDQSTREELARRDSLRCMDK